MIVLFIRKFYLIADDDRSTSSPTAYSSVDSKGVFRDKKEAIEAFKDFLKEKVLKFRYSVDLFFYKRAILTLYFLFRIFQATRLGNKL